MKSAVKMKGEFAAVSRLASAEGAVLLRNDEKILPLIEGDKVAVFGRVQLDWYRSGTGSGGSVNVPYKTNLLDSLREKQGIEINVALASVYEKWIEENPADYGDGSWASEPWFQKEMPLDDTIVEAASKVSDKALIAIGRTAGEDQDNKDEVGSYKLTEEEMTMLSLVIKHFDKVAVVLNVSNIIDMSWVETDIPKDKHLSVIYVWQGGMEGGRAAADILVGDVTPSGKLTDTIARRLEDYPSHANYDNDIRNFYQEDIYVGYRYFETFCSEKVLFEFGFGLSYTDFEMDCCSGRVVGDTLEFDVTVTNIGKKYSGKEVVQLYYEAPQGRLGKAKRVLAAFVKTDLLGPGNSEEVRIILPISQMASYDDSGVTGNKSCYVLEAGKYSFYIGNSVRDGIKTSVDTDDGYIIENDVVVKRLEEVLAPNLPFMRMKPGTEGLDGNYELNYEDTPQRTVDMAQRIQSRLPEEVVQTGNKEYILKDVQTGKVSMNDFIAQFTDSELATIVRGEGMGSPWVTQGTASAFGGVSESLRNYGLPVCCTADGPSGIRMDGGGEATQIPIGACLAASWNVPLIEELYSYEGKEMQLNHIDVLLGPGLNIKRHPLNGRNFEYFSEDPLITGLFASATVKGIGKSGCHATLKHFVCNNQERARKMVDAAVSERALREIYLKGFEIAVKEGDAKSVMTAYNPINGIWSASNYDLNTTVLRKEWGFDGFVMTDWWATMNDPILGGEAKEEYTSHMIRSQNDIYMVVGNFGAEINLKQDDTESGLGEGKLTRAELQRSAENICNFLMTIPAFINGVEAKEFVKAFKPLEIQDECQIDIAKAPDLIVNEGEENLFYNSEAGEYRLVASISYNASPIAQSECNVTLNGEHMSLIQTNGTEGQVVQRKLNKIYLQAGRYKLGFDFISSGVEVKCLTFVKE